MSILLDWSAQPVIAHRGNRAHAPENTLESLRQAIELGADAVEFDLRVSRDGSLVLMHDPTVDRTTNGRGLVSELTVRELRALDAGANFVGPQDAGGGPTFPWRNRGVTIPLFDEVVELVSDRPLLIELKTPEATPLVRAAIARHGIASRVVVAGFDASAIHPLRGAGMALGATTSDAMRLLPRALLGMSASSLPYQAVSIPPVWRGMRVPLARLARSLRASQTPLHVWTINDPGQARVLWASGVQGIVTDDPAVMLRARG